VHNDAIDAVLARRLGNRDTAERGDKQTCRRESAVERDVSGEL